MIEPVKRRPRQDWDKAFRLMHERHDDSPLIRDIDIEMEAWEWFEPKKIKSLHLV